MINLQTRGNTSAEKYLFLLHRRCYLYV